MTREGNINSSTSNINSSTSSNKIRHIIHPFAPIINASCSVLILGSVPSVQSAQRGFMYGNPHNRFWRLASEWCNISDMYSKPLTDKISTLIANHIALYDCIIECDIVGSKDDSVSNIVPLDIASLISDTDIKAVLCNGALAYRVATKYNQLDVPIIQMPSTSPANASYGYDRLRQVWSDAIWQYRLI